MKASLKGKYEGEKASAVATLAAPAGDLRFKASFTDATVARGGPSLEGLLLTAEKPGAFIVDFNVHRKDVRFQFMNTVHVLEKPISATYSHIWRENRTGVDLSVAFDHANKVSVIHTIGDAGLRLKYSYIHGSPHTIIEPSYDTRTNVWDFAVTRKFEGGDALKASYHTSTKILGVEWHRDSPTSGSFKISAAFNLAEKNISPKLTAESTWSCDF